MAEDRRVQRSKERVLQETYGLLSRLGVSGVSVDEISRCSGVSKATIYRHWPSRSALLLDACSQHGQAAALPDTGNFAGDAGALAGTLAGELKSSNWSAMLPSIVDAAERDPDVMAMHGRLHADRMGPFLEIARRARERGELAADADEADVAAALVGPLFYRRWFSREPLDAGFVARLVAAVVDQYRLRRQG